MRPFESPLDLALWRGQSLVENGTFYSWGGDDPDGFDCSGMMIECLTTAGQFDRGRDATAAHLRTLFPDADVPLPGMLLFWGTPLADGRFSITHVEMVFCILAGRVYTVGASGGGSRTKTKADAMRDNAFVKIRVARPGWVACVDPFVAWR